MSLGEGDQLLDGLVLAASREKLLVLLVHLTVLIKIEKSGHQEKSAKRPSESAGNSIC
jgi:hypothetical protein